MIERDGYLMMDKRDYPLWHGSSPMGPFLRDKLAENRFVVRGDGIRVSDADGNWFIDARSGLWNVGLGYSATEVTSAVRTQLESLPFGTLLSYDRPPKITVDYARELSRWFPELPWVRLGNSGSQMTETAVLLSQFVHRLEGNGQRSMIVSFKGSYHGMGPGASTLSGILDGLAGSGPLSPNVRHLASDAGSWTENLAQFFKEYEAERVAAVIFEPMMGSSGVIPEVRDLRGVAELCKANGVHLIADEVTTGFGRTGAMSRCIDVGIQPDMLVLGKNMACGYVPTGALMVAGPLYEAAYDPHPAAFLTAGSTTDGHPLAAAAGLAVLEYYRRHDVLAHVRKVGQYLQEQLSALQKDLSPSGDVAGAGLMQRLCLADGNGTPWSPPQTEELRLNCEAEGLLLSRVAGGIWLAPPLIVSEDDCQEIITRLRRALEKAVQSELHPAGTL